MSKRPILRLKNPPKLTPIAPAPPPSWKCKPCGALITVEGGDEKGDVRCPKCNARLGPLSAFTAEPPEADKVRARPVKAKSKGG